MARQARSVQMEPRSTERVSVPVKHPKHPRNHASLKPPRSSARRSTFHTAPFECWLAGDTIQTIADKFGVSFGTAWSWSRVEKWKVLAQRALERAHRKIIEQQAEKIGDIKLRHARIAKLGLTKVEKKLSPDARDPDAFELQQVAAATEKFVKVERVSREIAEPTPKESRLSEVLVALLERIDSPRNPRGAVVIEAESTRIPALAGSNHDLAERPSRLETARDGVDPRDDL